MVVHEKSRHRAERHGDVVGESIVAKGFAAAVAGRDVNTKGIAAYGDAAEKYAVESAQDDEPREYACRHIAKDYRRAEELAQSVEWFAGEFVHQVA